ncbi:unnamed protein product [Heterobilharzia americana]|nr:unnamed protein product [Heterobilharzia americana]
MRRYSIEVLGICESRCNRSRLSQLSTGESIIYSGHPEDNHEHTEFWSGYHDVPESIEGSHTVGINLLHHQDHDSKVQLKRKESHNHTTPRYAPTNIADEEKKEEFCRKLQSVLDKTQVQMATLKF